MFDVVVTSSRRLDRPDYDVVCIGAATEDIFFLSDRYRVEDQNLCFPWREKFTVEKLERHLGGGAFNASVAYCRLGLEVAFWGQVGNDPSGRMVKEALEREGISTTLLVVNPKTKTSTSALLSSGGERTIVMYRGANDDLLNTNPRWDKILDCRWIFFADLVGTSNDLLFEVVGKIKEGGIKLSYVPGQNELLLGKEKLAPVLAAAKILILNFHEAQSILGGGYSIKEMLVEFKKLGVGIPVITQDVEGSFAYDGKDFYHQEATPEVEVVDRTGAGDAFAATLTAGIILGKGIPESLLLAAKNASSEITKIGGTDGLLNLSQLESYQ